MYFLIIIGILIIFLVLLNFYKTKYRIYENLNDETLRAYLGIPQPDDPTPDAGYISGTNTSSGCTVNDKLGYDWEAKFTNGIRHVCVPTIYSDPDAYIPCSSANPGLPDNTECGDGKSIAGCQEEINKVKGIAPPGDEQQYVYVCRNKKCPCMNKYGKNYNGPVGTPYCYVDGWNCGELTGCVKSNPGDTGTFTSKQECLDKCNIPRSWNCGPDGCIGLTSDSGIYKTLDECKLNCPKAKSWNCGPDGCIGLTSNSGIYKTLDECKFNCSNISDISGYSGDIFWSKCKPAPYPNNMANPVNRSNPNNPFFNNICKSILPSSKYVSLDGRECPLKQTKIGCSFTSPTKLI